MMTNCYAERNGVGESAVAARMRGQREAFMLLWQRRLCSLGVSKRTPAYHYCLGGSRLELWYLHQ
jgi:hypothetical protein